MKFLNIFTMWHWPVTMALSIEVWFIHSRYTDWLWCTSVRSEWISNEGCENSALEMNLLWPWPMSLTFDIRTWVIYGTSCLVMLDTRAKSYESQAIDVEVKLRKRSVSKDTKKTFFSCENTAWTPQKDDKGGQYNAINFSRFVKNKMPSSTLNEIVLCTGYQSPSCSFMMSS